ncbi:Neugrin [Eumeta japonica]|uniref:Neugrin n=1 Tax=Eumeta variegata TaxID=151549 RepID=A0A4C1V6F7_EUMVA|nr:Neugrin [Eumeta japonica]
MYHFDNKSNTTYKSLLWFASRDIDCVNSLFCGEQANTYLSVEDLRLTVRNYRRVRYSPNPGLSHRVGVFKKEGVTLDGNVEEYVEESESDFLDLAEVHKEYESEERLQGKQLRRQIVKNKYFEESTPNLLTWSEKEQIRHLHNTEPTEWTPERIAESFPITVAVAKKILKYPWKPATEQRIARHDANAMRNWKEMEEGTLDISPEIRKHFLKFTNRTIPPLSKKSIKIDITQSEKIGDFQAIVDRCAAKDKSDMNGSENDSVANEDTTTLKKNKTYKKRTTLEELTNRIKDDIESGQNVDMPDHLLVHAVNSDTVIVPEETTNSHLEPSTEERSMIKWESEDENNKEIHPYPERIRIPKSARKRGATYKVNDCYYDDDGRFLYRVIGMTN